METVTNLIEDWIEMRSKLQRQMRSLETAQMRAGDHSLDATCTSATVSHLKRCISELNAVLKEHSIYSPV